MKASIFNEYDNTIYSCSASTQCVKSNVWSPFANVRNCDVCADSRKARPCSCIDADCITLHKNGDCVHLKVDKQ